MDTWQAPNSIDASSVHCYIQPLQSKWWTAGEDDFAKQGPETLKIEICPNHVKLERRMRINWIKKNTKGWLNIAKIIMLPSVVDLQRMLQGHHPAQIFIHKISYQLNGHFYQLSRYGRESKVAAPFPSTWFHLSK